MAGNVAKPSIEEPKSAIKAAQSSITSFFKPKAPSYTLPPSKSPSSTLKNTSVTSSTTPLSQANGNSATVSSSSPPPSDAEPPKKRFQNLRVGSPTDSEDADYATAASAQLQREAASVEPEAVKSPEPSPQEAPVIVSVPPVIKPKFDLPPQASIVPIQPGHVSQIKRINALLLCMSYPSWFYTQLSPPTPFGSYSRAILWDPSPPGKPGSKDKIVVGSLITRRDPVIEFAAKNGKSDEKGTDEGTGEDKSLYIAALTLLSPYRHYGLARAALESVLRQVSGMPTSTEGGGVRSLYCHVWTANKEGLEWYKRQGFRLESTVDGYYQKLSPTSAHILRRDIGVMDCLNGTAPTTNGTSAADEAGDIAAKEPPKAVRPPPMNGSARSFMKKGPENEWNDLPEHMVIPKSSGPPSARSPVAGSPAASSPAVSAPPSRSPSIPPPPPGGNGVNGASPAERRKKRSRAYPAAALNGDVLNGSGSGSGSQA